MSTVNPVQTTTYDLSVGNNPITFGAGTNINVAGGDAVYGDNAQAWSVTNQGNLNGQTGVYLADGGSVTNDQNATIGGTVGVKINGASGTVDNSGAINGGNGDAVQLGDGGTVTNEANATVYGTGAHASGISVNGGGTVVNDGAVTIKNGSYFSGIYLGGGGSVTNAGTITATGSYHVATINLNNGGTVTNTGAISNSGTHIAGVELKNGGTADNSGSITSSGTHSSGVSLSAGATLNNRTGGSITGGSGVYSATGGTVNNATGATITANSATGSGVVLNGGTGGSGSVDNFGKIAGAYGVILNVKATLTNESGGTIYGTGAGPSGVSLNDGGAVTNSGLISAAGSKYVSGVWVNAGGSVTNTGTISAGEASSTDVSGVGLGNGGSVSNSGTISATGMSSFSGVYLGNGGSVTNTKTITATGGAGASNFDGIDLHKGGALINSGTISATGGNGDNAVDLNDGGSVTNAAKGVLSAGAVGIWSTGAAATTIIDAGRISGTTDSIQFNGTGANSLTLQTGAVLVGAVIGSTGAGATNALVLQGKGTTKTAFENFTTLMVDKGAKWTLGGIEKFKATTVMGGTLTVAAALTSPLTLTLGGIAIFKVAYSGKTTFKGLGELELTKPYATTISGFGKGDKIDFLSVKFAATDKLKVSGGTVTVDNSLGKAIASFKVTGAHTASQFSLGKDAQGHLMVSGRAGAAALPSEAYALADLLRTGSGVPASADSSTALCDRGFTPLVADLALWSRSGDGET